jgi:hypothetical protein
LDAALLHRQLRSFGSRGLRRGHCRHGPKDDVAELFLLPSVYPEDVAIDPQASA